MANFVIL